MKKINLGYLIFVLFTVFISSCTGQMIKTLHDTRKLEDSAEAFVGKPLKDLLKQIKPEIKMAIADPSKNNQSKLGYIIFRFVDPEEY